MRRTAWSEGGVPIDVVARLLGVPVPTIRSWERRYGVPSPDRTTGGHRRYSHDDAVELRIMRDQIGRGQSAREAASAVTGRRVERPAPSRAHVEAFLAGVDRADAAEMRSALQASLDELGVERAIVDVTLVAMREVGFRWETGICDVGAEHLASTEVRTWLANMSAEMSVPVMRPVVLACGPKDLHTIGLEAFAVLLNDAGIGVAMLGAQVPEVSVLRCIDATDASGVVISSSMGTTRQAAMRSIRVVSARRETPCFYAGAAFTRPSARRAIPGTYLGDDFAQARRLVVAGVRDLASA